VRRCPEFFYLRLIEINTVRDWPEPDSRQTAAAG